MDVFEAISGRRSIRKFKKENVSDELIRKVVNAGIWAPSAGNVQAWEVIIVQDEEKRRKISEAAYMRDFISEAPVVMVSCANMERSGAVYSERGTDLYCIQDAACATQNMLLAAYTLGLGTCWVGSFDEKILRDLIDIPNFLRPVALVPMEYPDEKPYPPTRRNLEEFIHMEKFD